MLKNYLNKSTSLHYSTVWRWHFYAGLFCIPIIVLLSITGAIYLFKPQYEAIQNSTYDDLVQSAKGKQAEIQPASKQVLAALAAVPDSNFSAYQLPKTAQAAAQVMLIKNEELFRVYVNPLNLQVLHIAHEEMRLMSFTHRLHGQLLLGARGSYLVELAASWAIVMIITGLFLWWPRSRNGVAGVLYPRLTKNVVISKGKPVKSRIFWRDLHAVIGFWISFFTLFLLISGLPWTKSWGGLLREIRQTTVVTQANTAMSQQDWTIGGKPVPANTPVDEHAQHQHKHEAHSVNIDALDTMVTNVAALNLTPPVLVAAPSKRSANWTGKSNTQNRPLRVSVDLDANTGEILSRNDFADKQFLDRLVGYGIAIHEGQLFGWLNQLLGLITALGLIIVSVSGTVMWWRKRKKNELGAPNKSVKKDIRMPFGVLALILTITTLLPFLGLSLLIVFALERWILPIFPSAIRFLGLQRNSG